MTEQKTYPFQPLNWFLFITSLPIAVGGIRSLIDRLPTENWTTTVLHITWVLLPIYFYTEIIKYRSGYSKISITTKKLFKCRASGTDEVFYIRADTEAEVELFFETTLDGKNVFIEEANIKLLGFDMEIPTKTNEA